MTQLLQLEVRIQTQPVRFSMPCWVEVTLTNQHSAPLLINQRLAVGYKNRPDRELYAEVFRRGGNEVVSRDARLYQRDLPQLQDYISLEPGESKSTTFDLFRWYDIPGPGEYDLIVSYNADESSLQPEGLLTGIYSSPRVPFTVT